jgi:hypothetical protein
MPGEEQRGLGKEDERDGMRVRNSPRTTKFFIVVRLIHVESGCRVESEGWLSGLGSRNDGLGVYERIEVPAAVHSAICDEKKKKAGQPRSRSKNFKGKDAEKFSTGDSALHWIRRLCDDAEEGRKPCLGSGPRALFTPVRGRRS